MTQEDEIEFLQKELRENPRSPQFVKLAELYLLRDMQDAAFSLIKQSLKFHPRSTSGLILLGRIYKSKKQNFEALEPLTTATKLAYDNWRAWLELAEAYVELKNGKQALAAFKKVLLFNPTHPTARRAVAKLELLTADEYEDDLFEMKKLPETQLEVTPSINNQPVWTSPDSGLIRIISYIDALIIRHDLEKASQLLNECSEKYGNHPEIESRRLKLSVFEKPQFIEPKQAASASLAKREMINEKKITALKLLLRRIEEKKSDLLST